MNSRVSEFAKRTVFERCRANDVPTTDVERARIVEMVTDAQADLARFDEEILRTRQMLDDLEQKRLELQRFVDQAHSLDAPIRKLPLEILSEVFELYCLSDSSLIIRGAGEWMSTEERNQILCSTLDVSQTCAFWRSAVFSQPSLWALLDVDLDAITSPEVAQLSLNYLQTSKPSPLHIFAAVEENTRTLSAPALALFDTLFDESARWHTFSMVLFCRRLGLRLELTERAVTRIYSEGSQTSRFQILENLDWDWQPSFTPDEDMTYFDIVHSCPKLKRCDITAFRPSSLDSLSLPNLTDLRLTSYFKGYRLATLLSVLPQLRSCAIEVLRKIEDREPSLANIQSRFDLNDLSLGIFSDDSPSALDEDRFFQSLSLPRLKKLNFRWEAGGILRPHSGLLAMLARPECHPETLSVVEFREATTIQILEHLDSLSELRLWRAADLSAALFKRLTVIEDDDQTPNILPSLTSLQIYHERSKTRTRKPWWEAKKPLVNALCAMVQSRCGTPLPAGVSRLKSLTLQTIHSGSTGSLGSLSPQHPLRQRLQPFVDEGLELKLIQ